MTQSAAEMLERWAKLPADAPLDIAKEMIAVTLHVVGRSLFSVDLLGDSRGFGRSIEAGSAYFAYRLGRLFAPPLWVPTKINREYKAASLAMLHLVPELIAARRRLIDQQGTADESGRAYDMLDLLLETRYEDTGEPMSDEQLDREIRLFIAAGHETTSNTLTWTLYLLSQHPAAESKLHAEIDSVLGGRTPSMADLPKLPYTKQVIEESMRLYPAAWIVARQSIAEDQLGPYHVPANQGVAMPIYAVHRHPDYWPEAERFDPERFAPENAAKQHKYAYFPFGGGPRMCIGSLFALAEAQLILTMIAQKYTARLQPGYVVQPQALITLKVKNGLPMTLVKR